MILIVKKMYSKSKLIFMFHFSMSGVWWEDLWPKNTRYSVRASIKRVFLINNYCVSYGSQTISISLVKGVKRWFLWVNFKRYHWCFWIAKFYEIEMRLPWQKRQYCVLNGTENYVCVCVLLTEFLFLYTSMNKFLMSLCCFTDVFN